MMFLMIVFQPQVEIMRFHPSHPRTPYFQLESDSFCNGKTFCNEITRALSGVFALDDCLEIDSQMVVSVYIYIYNPIRGTLVETLELGITEVGISPPLYLGPYLL